MSGHSRGRGRSGRIEKVSVVPRGAPRTVPYQRPEVERPGERPLPSTSRPQADESRGFGRRTKPIPGRGESRGRGPGFSAEGGVRRRSVHDAEGGMGRRSIHDPEGGMGRSVHYPEGGMGRSVHYPEGGMGRSIHYPEGGMGRSVYDPEGGMGRSVHYPEGGMGRSVHYPEGGMGRSVHYPEGGMGRSVHYPEGGQGDVGGSERMFSKLDVKGEESGEYEMKETSQSSIKESAGGTWGGGGDQKVTPQREVVRRRKRDIEIIHTKPETCVTKKGSTGSPVVLTANYFDIQSLPNWILYQYQVNFDIDEPREGVRRAWLYKHYKAAIRCVYIFDGGHMYTYKRLTDKLPDVLKLETDTKEGTTVHIHIKFVQELHRGHGAYLQVFNVLLRRCLGNLKLQLVHRNYFDPKAAISLPSHFMQIWPGYVTSIRQHDGGIMMCAQITHKIMRTDTAYDILKSCTSDSDYKRSFQQAIIGAVVLTDYTNKTYQIADVDFDKNPLSTFINKGREITFVEYYRTRYNLPIHDLKQPLLATRKIDKAPKNAPESQKSTREILLIPELCKMTGLNKAMLKNRVLLKDMSQITRVSPKQRIERLGAFNNRLYSEPQVLQDFTDWGLKLSRQLKTIKGRILPPETILAGKGRSFPTGRDCDWTVPLRSSPMFANGVLNRWVFITTYSLKDTVERFLPCLKKAADGMHMKLPAPIIMPTKTEYASELVDVIEKALAQHQPDLIAFGFSNDRLDRYNAVKRKCCVDRGVPSQVILLRSMTAKGVLSIATKIAIQIHAKTGGVPWNVPLPSDTCMVVGFDVCHDAFTKSVGATVASTSPNMTSWFSAVNQHSSRVEISFFLANDIFKAVIKYLERNNALPTRIIVYRDGVGEGQIGQVMEHEVNALKEKLTELYRGNTWKLAYIIVTKRINTRFFSNAQNPSPGTIVDDEITQPERYDFYLVSQIVRQGTVSPTQYNVISDNIGWSADKVQRFTYKLTHLYYNNASPVQVPAPCQYAHKLAFLTHQNLQSGHHRNLDEKLFFL